MEAAELIEQIEHSDDTHRQRQCRHTLPGGRRCGSPAMRGEKYCYYHHQTRKPVANPQGRQARRNCFHIAPPRTRAAIQESIGEIITRLAYNEIDTRRAGLLLYALQIATTNIKDHQAGQQPAAKDSTPGPNSTPEPNTAESNRPSKDTFDTELFPNPQSHETAAALYQSLIHQNSTEPQPAAIEPCRPEPLAPEVLPTLQAAAAPTLGTSSRPEPLSEPMASRTGRTGEIPVSRSMPLATACPAAAPQTLSAPTSSKCLQLVSGLSFHRIKSFPLSTLPSFVTS